MTPVIASDAGFRSDWFRAVSNQGWDGIGRIRDNVKVQPVGQCTWRSCADLFARARLASIDSLTRAAGEGIKTGQGTFLHLREKVGMGAVSYQ
jgi:hypothetical protein